MTDFWEPPEEYHVLVTAGVCYFITFETRVKIETFLLGANRRDQISIPTIPGETVTVFSGSVDVIFSSTPETRRREASIRNMIETDTGEAWK